MIGQILCEHDHVIIVFGFTLEFFIMNAEAITAIDTGTVISLAGLLYLLSAGYAVVHVLLNKQNVGAAVSWIGVIVLSPFFGVALYWLFGVNRIRRRARAEKQERVDRVKPSAPFAQKHEPDLTQFPEPQQSQYQAGLQLHDAPYLSGNQIDVLMNGVEAFPQMLEAINSASASIVMSSYIFQYDSVGKQFVEALSAAHLRGVSVRVLIDGLGVGYGFSFTKADRKLRANNVPTARFLPTFSAAGTRFINLRNHRKILSVDGACAFVGGMNIRAGNMLDGSSRHQTQDVHFRVCGPAIDQINQVFQDDWQYATGEPLVLPVWAGGEPGQVVCRVLLDGPDDNYKKLELCLIAAINAARKRIAIVTPYFIPDAAVIHALQLAVLRGVDVRVLIPDKNNLVFVDWAMRANESNLLDAGIKIFRSQPPFDHSKLFVVDGCWSLIGSSNWDSRSIELNFEINVECFDQRFSEDLERVINEKHDRAVRLTRSQSSLLARLRNNFFRLFTPYL